MTQYPISHSIIPRAPLRHFTADVNSGRPEPFVLTKQTMRLLQIPDPHVINSVIDPWLVGPQTDFQERFSPQLASYCPPCVENLNDLGIGYDAIIVAYTATGQNRFLGSSLCHVNTSHTAKVTILLIFIACLNSCLAIKDFNTSIKPLRIMDGILEPSLTILDGDVPSHSKFIRLIMLPGGVLVTRLSDPEETVGADAINLYPHVAFVPISRDPPGIRYKKSQPCSVGSTKVRTPGS